MSEQYWYIEWWEQEYGKGKGFRTRSKDIVEGSFADWYLKAIHKYDKTHKHGITLVVPLKKEDFEKLTVAEVEGCE